MLRVQTAAFSRSEESSVLASAQGNSGFPAVAEHMRRLFGPRGGAVAQDVLIAADFDVSWEDGVDFEEWVAYCKA